MLCGDMLLVLQYYTDLFVCWQLIALPNYVPLPVIW